MSGTNEERIKTDAKAACQALAIAVALTARMAARAAGFRKLRPRLAQALTFRSSFA